MVNDCYLYGLDNWIISPPLSAIFAVLMIIGTDKIGEISLRKFGLLKKENFSALRMQTIPVGIMFLGIFLYPLALIQATPIIFMNIIAASIVTLGIFNLIILVSKLFKVGKKFIDKNNIFVNLNFDIIFIITILFFLFLISLGPITNADSLDYHIGYPIALLNNGGMIVIPEWFLGLYSASGEIINALGLSIGSEQFGSLIQWASLVAIISLIWPKLRNLSINQINSGYLIVVAAVSAPVILFLLSGPKPQMWPVSMTCLAFYIYLNTTSDVSDKNLKKRFLFVCMLCMSASIAKFNYLLGGTIVGILMLIPMIRRNELFNASILFILSFLILYLPHILWKMYAMHASILEILINPLPIDIPGIENALASWKLQSDISSSLVFPLSIMIPDSFGSISAVLGIGWILLFKYRFLNKNIEIFGLLAIIALVALTVFFAPPSGRMYIESYFWALILLSYSLSKNLITFPKYFFWIIRSQALMFLLLSLIGAYTLFPGSLSERMRNSVMTNTASGYNLMNWVDLNLPEEAILINSHRSTALVPRKSFNNSFWKYYIDMDNKEEIEFYLNRMKLIKPTHILVLNEDDYDMSISNCFGEKIAGPQKFKFLTRNPFNSREEYAAVIYNFNNNILPECAFKN